MVKSVEAAPDDFHSRFDAKAKVYRYTILNSRVPTALHRNYCLLSSPPVDQAAMRSAAEHLIGEHDFRSFTTEAKRKPNTVRTVSRAQLDRDGEYVYFTIEANGFLYNMVRAIVGTLLEVGRRKITPMEFREILENRDRSRAGPNAPAKGLCLVEVRY